MPHVADILDRVSDAVVALDTSWRYTYVNSRAAELFGRRPEDLLGRNIWTEFPEGVGQPFHLAYEKAMAEQVPVQMENYYEPWHRWFENRIYPLGRRALDLLPRDHRPQRSREVGEPERGPAEGSESGIGSDCPGGAAPRHPRFVGQAHRGAMPRDARLDSAAGFRQGPLRHGSAPSLPAGLVEYVDGQTIGPRAALAERPHSWARR